MPVDEGHPFGEVGDLMVAILEQQADDRSSTQERLDRLSERDREELHELRLEVERLREIEDAAVYLLNLLGFRKGW